jgi:hypothetical protein
MSGSVFRTRATGKALGSRTDVLPANMEAAAPFGRSRSWSSSAILDDIAESALGRQGRYWQTHLLPPHPHTAVATSAGSSAMPKRVLARTQSSARRSQPGNTDLFPLSKGFWRAAAHSLWQPRPVAVDCRNLPRIRRLLDARREHKNLRRRYSKRIPMKLHAQSGYLMSRRW